MSVERLMATPQFTLSQADKEVLLVPELRRLTEFHRHACAPYDRMMAALGAQGGGSIETLADVPFLPVSLFKQRDLRSVPDNDVIKVLTSSGTTGQGVSRIALDSVTADRQTRALAAIMTTALGDQRLPMIIVDTPNLIRDRALFSARGAGVLGMVNFGHHHFYALDDDMALDRAGLNDFLARFAGQPILIFGFTFMVWKYLLAPIRGQGVDLSRATLIHSGGWKRLQDEAVDNAEFKRAWLDETGLADVRNFYGMVEQVGGVFLEADDGTLRPPSFGDVIIRDPMTWQPVSDGEVGVVQVLSILPESYPGHSVLTEDLGVVHGVSSSGWLGRRLEIIGRVPKAELRGCSDVHAIESLAS